MFDWRVAMLPQSQACPLLSSSEREVGGKVSLKSGNVSMESGNLHWRGNAMFDWREWQCCRNPRLALSSSSSVHLSLLITICQDAESGCCPARGERIYLICSTSLQGLILIQSPGLSTITKIRRHADSALKNFCKTFLNMFKNCIIANSKQI